MFFKDKWITEMTQVLKNTTELTDKAIKSLLEEEFDKNFKDTEAIIFNSYDREITDTSLANVMDWIQVRKPIVTEAGTFFKRVDEGRALHAQIVFGNLMNREILKGEMFKALETDDLVTAKDREAGQLLEKLRANAPYGVDGNPYSFSYSYNVSSTTTFSARGQTSMAALNFENMINDYVKFDNMEELFVYINNILREKGDWIYKTFDVIDIVPSKDDLFKRLINKFEDGAEYDEELIRILVDKLTDKERSRIFYKSNLRKFTLNEKVKTMINDICMNDDVEFVNPYKPEKDIQLELKLLAEIVHEFVGYKYQPFRYEDKIRHKKRAATIVMDTDSTILYIGNLIEFIKRKVADTRLFRTREQVNSYDNKIMNIIVTWLDKSIDTTIDFYLGKLNVDNSEKRVKMKNEFAFGMVIVTNAKKSYISSVLRKEGVVYTKPKLDLKGVSFFKSSSTPKTTKFIVEEILEKRLLFNKKGKIDLFDIKKAIEGYKASMRDDIINGDLSYHKRSIKVKSADGYKDAMSIPQYRGVHVWNMLNPDDIVELPATITLLKVKLYKKKDLAVLEDYPEIYESLSKFFDEEGERLVKVATSLSKGSLTERDIENIKKNVSLTSIAMPNTLDAIPEWLLAILDVEIIVSNNMSLFDQLYKPLSLGSVDVKHNSSNKNMTYYTNIIRI